MICKINRLCFYAEEDEGQTQEDDPKEDDSPEGKIFRSKTRKKIHFSQNIWLCLYWRPRMLKKNVKHIAFMYDVCASYI